MRMGGIHTYLKAFFLLLQTIEKRAEDEGTVSKLRLNTHFV